MRRFEAFRRSALKRKSVLKLVKDLGATSIKGNDRCGVIIVRPQLPPPPATPNCHPHLPIG